VLAIPPFEWMGASNYVVTRNALLAGIAEEIISEFFDTELDEVNLEVPDTCAVSS